MNRVLSLLLVSIFGIFVGSQLTEGILFVPYWKSLSTADFYQYYATFGPGIIRFYSILTTIAVLIPISTSVYCFFKKSQALKYSLVATFFALLILGSFYIYFKDVNQQFFESAFNADQLKAELNTWERWHWLRVLFEFLALIFLALTLNILSDEEGAREN